MPAKGSSKNPRYLGLDARHYAMWRAECGHTVWTPRAKLCFECSNARRRSANYLGRLHGRQMYLAPCGHAVRNPKAKQCRACVHKYGYRQPDAAGYFSEYSPERRKNRRVHVGIAERVLKRRLKPGECVHHLNMDKSDNRNCNLLICTESYHQQLHHAMARAYARGCAPPKEG